MSKISCWIEAMRLRTLPVSVAGVIAATALAVLTGHVRWTPVALCLAFAVLAQIASNFANEYYDYRDGLDRPGREGPRRGVTEGDITPRAMKAATFVTLALACCVGLSLVVWGGWWLVAVGVAVALGVVAYSAGPWPLSRIGLGEVAVIAFFGLVPVNFTYYLATGTLWQPMVMLTSVSVGLMGANVLVVNNFRDRDDDAAVGKRTLAVRFGLNAMRWLYAFNGLAAMVLMTPLWSALGLWSWLIPAIYFELHMMIWMRLVPGGGRRLNPLLGMTAMLMLAFAVALLVATATSVAG